MMIMFAGGVRCGKSALAQAWAEKAASERVYIAVARPLDAEMEARIVLHKAQRGAGWRCIEESLRPLAALRAFLRENPGFNGAVLLDSLDMLLNNFLCENFSNEEVLSNMDGLLAGLAASGLPCAIVSAECGQGFVPQNPLARRFGDLLGLVNQRAAKACGSVAQVLYGLPLVLKGGLKGVSHE